MKGRNTMTLNQATMMEIVEYWLTNKLINSLQSRVVGIRSVQGGGATCFELELEPLEEKPADSTDLGEQHG